MGRSEHSDRHAAADRLHGVRRVAPTSPRDGADPVPGPSHGPTPGRRRQVPRHTVDSMEFRYLGNSGLKISEITYGNWLTHGSQVENDVATQCVRAALDAGITHLRHRRRLRQHQGRDGARRGPEGRAARVAWRSSPRSTGPPAPAARTTPACPASTSWSRSTARCERLQTDYVDLYQAHRYDTETPLEETMQAFADVVRQGKALYIGVSEWTADQIREGVTLRQGARLPARSRSQPQYSMLWRVIEDEVVPTCRGARRQPDRLVPDRPGRADRQVPAGPAAARRARAPPTRRAAPT